MTAARMTASLPLFFMSALVLTGGKPSQAYDTTETAPQTYGLAVEKAMSQPPTPFAATIVRAERMAKVRALRGKYAFVGISSDDYLKMKHELRDRF